MVSYSLRRRSTESRTEAEYTDSTHRSSAVLSRGGSDGSFNDKRLFSRIKFPVTRLWKSRRKLLSEARLREKLIKRAERGDWDAVRKLVANFEFTDIPEPSTSCAKIRNNSSAQILEEGSLEHQNATRRPSYGSRSGERLSFTGKESAAAAAAIKAALLDESSESSSQKPDIGENVLHDLVRYNPPLDVIETLLVSLEHRRGTTSGTDERGRTPLHVASAFGAAPEVINALIRADPGPASMGDVDMRSPLHIAVRFLAYGATDDNPLEENRLQTRRSIGRDEPSEEVIFEQSAKTIFILKDAMVNNPGNIDFKDEDNTGFAPVDYALDGGVTDEGLLQCLLRRKHASNKLRCSMNSVASADTQTTSNLVKHVRRQSSGVSSTGSSASQDLAMLQCFEEEELQDRRTRLEKISTTRNHEKEIKDVLFDVFGINELAECGPTSNHPSTQVDQLIDPSPRGILENSTGCATSQSRPQSSKSPSSGSSLMRQDHSKGDGCQSMTDSAIYNRHLEAYLNDFAGDEGLEFYDDDDDDFDIHHDPEEDYVEAQQLGVSTLPVMDIYVDLNCTDDDSLSQCSYARSVVSEVTVPSFR